MKEEDIEIGKRYYARTSNQDTYITIVEVKGHGHYGLLQGSKRKQVPEWLVFDIDRGKSIRIGTIRKFLSRVDD